MIKKVFFFVIVVALLSAGAAVMAQGTPSSPVSDAGITPYIIDGDSPGGNRTCAEVGLAFYGNSEYYEFSTARVNLEDIAGFPAEFNVSTDGTYVSWGPFAHGGLAVIVKGSSDANVYAYDPPITSDSGLASPVNSSGKPAGLSNLTICWNPPPVVEVPEWCSPGYWRQEHHLASWPAAFSPDDPFYDALHYYPTLSNQGKRNGATTNPTLWQVLQSPQWYGGDAFNAVGDLLSAAHPDVNFTGERVEDSCPLN